MKYVIYRLHFSGPVHFGKNALSNSEYSLCSDTLFSALCTEAVAISSDKLEEFVEGVRNARIKLSDALPYINDEYMIPKPYVFIERSSVGDSVERKAYKNLKYIPLSAFDAYLHGEFDVFSAQSIDGLGKSAMKVSVSISNEKEESMPYEVGLFSFNENCGLYIVFGFEDDQSELLIDELLAQLSLSGVGGKRSSGYGRFSYIKDAAEDSFADRMNSLNGKAMLLNTALPTEEELKSVIEGASYSLTKRSGFVASVNYSDEWQRKKDIVMFKAGSCFNKPFNGDIYDVATNAGTHPVYRCGKPLFLRIDV